MKISRPCFWYLRLLCNLSFALAIVLISSVSLAQTTEPIPIDRAVVQGRLDNGIRYLIRQTETGGAELRLVARVGSLDEENNELGYAHFVEHMAFRKTKRFVDGEIINFVRSMGGNFGQHLNAFTTYDQTQYWLSIPPNRADALPKAMQIVADWAHGVEFPENLSAIERGVVISEKRGRDLGNDPSTRIRSALFDQNLYRRSIIGTDQSLATVTSEGLRNFYKKHYTPERLTIVLTGRLIEGVGYWERMLKDEFGVIPAAAANSVLPRRPNFVFQKRVRVLQLSGARNHRISIGTLEAKTALSTKDDLRASITRGLTNGVLGQRLRAALKDQTEVLDAGIVDSSITDDARLFEIVATVASAEHYLAGQKLLTNVVQKFLLEGPTPTELAAVKQPYINSARVAEQESIRAAPTVYAIGLATYAHSGGVYLSYQRVRELVEELIPTINAKDLVTQLAERYFAGDFLVVAQSPQGEAAPTVNRALLSQSTENFAATLNQSVASSRATSEVRPQEIASAALPAIKPAGSIVNEETLADDVTRLTLSNGGVVYIKPTRSSVDQVYFSMQVLGGFRSLQANELAPARLIGQGVLSANGIGPLDRNALDLEIKSKGIFWQSNLVESATNLTLRTASSQLPYAMHLMHLWLRESSLQNNSLKLWVTQNAKQLAEVNPSPMQRFRRDWLRARRGASSWVEPNSVSDFEGVTLNQVNTVRERLMGDASKMVFTFTGNVSLRDLRRLSETYLANLPSSGSQPLQKAPVQWQDNGQEKAGVKSETRAGTIPRVTLVLRYYSPQVNSSIDENNTAIFLQAALSERLRLALRANSGLTYTPNSQAFVFAAPAKGGIVNLEAQLAPTDLAQAEALMRQTVQSLIDTPPTNEELIAMREAYRTRIQTIFGSPDLLAGLLTSMHHQGTTMNEFKVALRRVMEGDTTATHERIKRWLEGVPASVGVLRPVGSN
jgi:zinc protease